MYTATHYIIHQVVFLCNVVKHIVHYTPKHISSLLISNVLPENLIYLKYRYWFDNPKARLSEGSMVLHVRHFLQVYTDVGYALRMAWVFEEPSDYRTFTWVKHSQMVWMPALPKPLWFQALRDIVVLWFLHQSTVPSGLPKNQLQNKSWVWGNAPNIFSWSRWEKAIEFGHSKCPK